MLSAQDLTSSLHYDGITGLGKILVASSNCPGVCLNIPGSSIQREFFLEPSKKGGHSVSMQCIPLRCLLCCQKLALLFFVFLTEIDGVNCVLQNLSKFNYLNSIYCQFKILRKEPWCSWWITCCYVISFALLNYAELQAKVYISFVCLFVFPLMSFNFGWLILHPYVNTKAMGLL